MDPKIIIIIAVSYLYGFFEVFMNWRQRSESKVVTSIDKNSCVWSRRIVLVQDFLLVRRWVAIA